MPRKSNRNNLLQIRVKARSIPKSVKPKRYLQILLDVIDGRRNDVPPLWDVALFWRNPGTKHGLTRLWREDSFTDAVNESRSGFVQIVRSELVRLLRRLTVYDA